MFDQPTRQLSAAGRRTLLAALKGRLLAVCYGAGVDSTALLIALRLAGLQPHIITFADLAAEKPETMAHLDLMNSIVVGWGWEPIITCRKVPLASTGYDDLYGNCMANETLPSLAFGMKSCSLGLAFESVFLAVTGDGPPPRYPKSWRWSARPHAWAPACSCRKKAGLLCRRPQTTPRSCDIAPQLVSCCEYCAFVDLPFGLW